MDSVPGSGNRDHFDSLTDPRVDRAKRHLLLDIVTVALCGVICGAESWGEIEPFGPAKLAWLRTFLALPHGIPSHDPFGRVFAALDPAQFERCFLAWVRAIAPQTGGQVIALEGETVRRSHDRAAGQAALPLVSAGACANRLVLGQVAVDAKSTAIPALPALQEVLLLRGGLVTSDAMGCQTAIARPIVAQEADDVLALKGNQGTLYRDVADLFTAARASGFRDLPHDFAEAVEKAHGRVETRRCWAVSEPAILQYLNPDGAWAGLRSVALVEATRRVGTMRTVEMRYYLSSLPGAAALVGRAARQHWGIENSVHWALDVIFREDDCRVRRGDGAQNCAVLRRLALNLLRQERIAKVGLQAKRLRAGWDQQYLLRVLAGTD